MTNAADTVTSSRVPAYLQRLNEILIADRDQLTALAARDDLSNLEVSSILQLAYDPPLHSTLYDSKLRREIFKDILWLLRNYPATIEWAFTDRNRTAWAVPTLAQETTSHEALERLVHRGAGIGSLHRDHTRDEEPERFDEAMVTALDRLLQARPELLDDVVDGKLGHYANRHVALRYIQDRDVLFDSIRYDDQRGLAELAKRFANDEEFAPRIFKIAVAYSSGDTALRILAEASSLPEVIEMFVAGVELDRRGRTERVYASEHSRRTVAARFASDPKIAAEFLKSPSLFDIIAKKTTSPRILARLKRIVAVEMPESQLDRIRQAKTAYGLASRGPLDATVNDIQLARNIIRVAGYWVPANERGPGETQYATLRQLAKSTTNPEVLLLIANIDNSSAHEAMKHRALSEPELAPVIRELTPVMEQTHRTATAQFQAAEELTTITNLGEAASGEWLAYHWSDVGPTGVAARERLGEFAQFFDGYSSALGGKISGDISL